MKPVNMRPRSAFSIRGPAMELCDVIKCGYFQHVRLLVDMGLDVELTDSEGKSSLILCAFIEPESWGVGIARILIESGSKVSVQDYYGLNVLHYACIYGRFQLARILLNALDFDINQIDRYGNTGLHYAVKSGNSMITKLIVQCLKRYNLPIDIPNKHGVTSLQQAYRLNHLSCVKLLEEDDTFEIPCEDTNLILGFENTDRVNSKKCRRECCRSAPVYGSRHLLSKTFKPLKQNQRDHERIIRCASPKDFRNTRENIFKLTALSSVGDNAVASTISTPEIRRPKPAFVRRNVSEESDLSSHSWRDELRSLYLSYEFQCTSSWRRPVKPLEIKIEVPAVGEDCEKLRDRRIRRPSCTSRLGLNLDIHNQRRRSSFTPRIPRKGSTSNFDKRSPIGDNVSLASSNESIASLSPRSKKEAPGKGDVTPKSPKLLSVI